MGYKFATACFTSFICIQLDLKNITLFRLSFLARNLSIFVPSAHPHIVHSANMYSYVDQANVRDYNSYPPPGQAYAEGKPPAYVVPPPAGYPMNSTDTNSKQVPAETRSRGEGFWKGCCAALCCCCMVDMCF